ncbi:hypothetical protein C0993_009927 [Termitomyces sp. T159_Od127]|nr:hypothetical protein C0993_009927 [Termitomyces sp. T159_Od127]
MYQAKPLTFQLESSWVAFTASYLQGIAFDHYTALLWFNPNSLVLSNWQAFAQEFSNHPHLCQWSAAKPMIAHDLSARIRPLILGLPWLCSTNPRINWQNLTLHFDCQATEHLKPIPFDVTAPISTADLPHTPPQLHSNSAQSFILNARLGKSPQVLTALIDSGATKMFVSDQLNLTRDPLDRPMELQLFDTPSPSTMVFGFQSTSWSWQLLEVTPIVLGLLWLHDVNPDIDWRDLTMKFPRSDACLATFSLHLQSTNNPSKARATSASTASPDNSGKPPSPWHTLGAPLAFLPNIPCNKYKGPNYPTHRPWMTSDPNNADQPPKPLDLDALNIKIIGLAPFAHIIQDGTPAFQLHISPALLEEHLGADTTTLEPKIEEQI